MRETVEITLYIVREKYRGEESYIVYFGHWRRLHDEASVQNPKINKSMNTMAESTWGYRTP